MQAHQAVFELSVAGEEQWQGILTNVENLLKAFAGETCELEIVTHGKGLGLVLKTNQALSARLQSLASAGVAFAACQNTMQRMNVKPEDLFPFAIPVDAGVAEVLRKQEAGWSYIKAGS